MKTITRKGFVSAFPGTGKSTIYNGAPKNGLYPVRQDGTAIYRSPRFNKPFVYDSDSSTFDKSEFPENYIKHMKDVIHRDPINFLFLGSSHETVRRAMQNAGLPYLLVYPNRSLKDEYIERYKKRGSPQAFIDLMSTKWDSFIDSCETDPNDKIVLESNQYLIDVL